MATVLKTKKTYTIEEFMALPEPEDGTRQELVDGEIEEIPPAGEQHSSIEINLISYLAPFVHKNKSGRVHSPDVSFVLGPALVRSPDVSFVSAQRRDPSIQEEGAVPIPPDLAVEVVSPSERLGRVNKKLREYQKAGVALIWIIYPKKQKVHVYRAGNPEKEILHIDDTLDGEDVVKGFELSVKDLFE